MDQVAYLRSISNLTAAYKGSSDEDDRNILDGRVDIVYGSPEALVGNPEWRESMRSSLEVSTIVIDEFHTIATW
uniref:DEAD/DEAH-box helicase domain-containing protein n=1 Tax=Magallana gigas TaxID=29159 RepID=A0A8W8NVH0_MAGGI